VKVLRTFGLALVVLLAGATAALSQTWQPLTHQPTFQASTALLMTDGTIMVHQYGGLQWWKLTPDNTGSYVNGTFTQEASLPSNYSPLYYSSAVLNDGRLIVEGGEYNFLQADWTNLGAIYDPLANAWTPVNPPSGWNNIGDAQNVVLANAKFMLANALTSQDAVFNSTNLTWTAVGTGKLDGNDEEGWTLLPDTTVLTVDCNNTANLTQAEKFLPPTRTWVSAGSTVAQLPDLTSSGGGSHEIGPAVLRPDGTVFATGATGHTAIYTPPVKPTDPGTWVAGPDFPKVGGQLDIADGPASLLPSGNVLVDASPGVFLTGSHFYEFDGSQFIAEPGTPNSSKKSSYEGRMLLLPTGQILFTDGSNDVEVYTPVGNPNPAWAPVINNFPSSVTRGTTYSISGTQFNGLSQAVAYGDDATAATNYALVRITNQATGHVFYAKTHHPSTMGVATKGRRVATHFDVPANMETGASNLEVVANGIASTPVVVTVQ
jgi:hypothetical protein